jgi:pseudouridine synthase
MIFQGRVAINGEVIEKPGVVIDEEKDQVLVDGKQIQLVTNHTYILLNKPAGIISSVTDPQGRKTVTQLLQGVDARVYPVGRLDLDTEGLLLLTDDGELAHRLTHPRYEGTKIYEATVAGRFDTAHADLIKAGIKLEDGAIGHGKVEIVRRGGKTSEIRILLKEGRKREVKQLCAAVGHPVRSLRRVAFASLRDEGLGVGQWRELTSEELASLRQLVQLN